MKKLTLFCSIYFVSLIMNVEVFAWTLPQFMKPRSTSQTTTEKKKTANDYLDEARTNLTIDTCHRVGVTPLKSYQVTKWDLFVFKIVGKFRRRFLMHLLHFMDRIQMRMKLKIPNASLNLEVLWWKAMVETKQKHKSQSQPSWAYDMLPPVIRRCLFLPPFRWIFCERAVKAVELRTAYIDSILDQQVPHYFPEPSKIRLVSLGAGYDMRAFRMNANSILNGSTTTAASNFSGFHESVELDLEPVVKAKKWLIQNRLLPRRTKYASILNEALADKTIEILPTELNQYVSDGSLKQTLLERCAGSSSDNNQQWCHVFVLEAILMYLDEGIPSNLLKLLAEVAQASGRPAILIFADRLLPSRTKHSDSDAELRAREFLQESGWDVKEYLPVRGYELGWAVLS